MVEKEGSNSEKNAFETYKAAREEHEHAAESDDDGDKVSSALIERVRTVSFIKFQRKARN
jgi:LETM1 and EF-hand domain-containing protein 1